MQPDPQQKSTIPVKNVNTDINTSDSPSGLKYFDPSQRLYVRAVSGTYQRLRRYGGWVLMLLFSCCRGYLIKGDKRFCWM